MEGMVGCLASLGGHRGAADNPQGGRDGLRANTSERIRSRPANLMVFIQQTLCKDLHRPNIGRITHAASSMPAHVAVGVTERLDPGIFRQRARIACGAEYLARESVPPNI